MYPTYTKVGMYRLPLSDRCSVHTHLRRCKHPRKMVGRALRRLTDIVATVPVEKVSGCIRSAAVRFLR